MTDRRELVVVESEGLNVSKIIWRRFRRPMGGLLARVLRENPHLVEVGPGLPRGTRFELPIPSEDVPVRPVIRLDGVHGD